MARVIHTEDGDAVTVRWGETGRPHSFRVGDDSGLKKAWRAAVAEALVRGESIEDEVDRSVAREMQGEVGITKAADGGLCIAWWPRAEVAAEIAALGTGVTPEDLHLTLLYLDDQDGLEARDWDLQLVAAVCKIFSRRYGPFQACVTGVGRFVGPEDEDVIILLVDGGTWLADFRCALRDELMYHSALPYDSALYNEQYGFIPHITLAYVSKTAASPPPLTEKYEFEIDNITLAVGGIHATFPLLEYEIDEGSIADAAPLYNARNAIEKAGRVLSGSNLAELEAAIEALTVLADSERSRIPAGELDEAALEKRRAILAAHDVASPDGAMEYMVTKATSAKRYTYGPLYAPNRKDVHGEFVDPEVLQEAVWDYVRASAKEGRRLNLQHGDLGEVTVAEWVEVTSWPYEHEITVKTAGGKERQLKMPAGTVYIGAIWDEDSWPLVEKGALNGWSLGGRAVRVTSGHSMDDMEPMGDALTSKRARRAEPAPAPAPAADDNLTITVTTDAGTILRERELATARKEQGA